MGDSQSLVALIDCNNFYVSCERVFNPAWQNRPVAVLSNNDGCVVARSKEVKAMGVPMGVPYFQVRDLLERQNAVVVSSNYALYGDLSHRVMETLRSFSPDVEIYSIDEAFLTLQKEDPIEIRKRVLKWTGIPVSIGIGATKTIAKAAAELAKGAKDGVFWITEANRKQVLSELPAGEVWGIGRRLSKRMEAQGIFSAEDFAEKSDEWIRKHYGVIGLRMALELRGISTLELSDVEEKKKSIMYSRSFAQKVRDLLELEEAISSYTAGAAAKMRRQESLASAMEVYVYGKELHSFKKVYMTFPEPLDYTPDLVLWAKAGINALFDSEEAYRKVGVLLLGLVDKGAYQCDLFDREPVSPKKEKLSALMDAINQKKGKGTLKFLGEGTESPWKMRREKNTGSYTTDWDHLKQV